MKKMTMPKPIRCLLVALAAVLLTGMSALAAESMETEMKQTETKGQYQSVCQLDAYMDVYHRIDVKKSSVLYVTGNEVTSFPSAVKVTLCNDKKKALDSDVYVYANQTSPEIACFAVKKGTYYLKTPNVKNLVLLANVKAVSEKSGTSKTKAKTIKKNKTVSGLILNGEKKSKADWYKFKVTKKKKLQLTLSAATNGYFDFYLYGPSYPKGIRIDRIKDKKAVYYSINALNRKKLAVKTGTYYLKVVRNSSYKKASGLYTLKWNLK